MQSPSSVPPHIHQQLAALRVKATEPERQLMTQLSQRGREPNGGATDVSELVELKEDRNAAVAFFKELDKAGCGQFKAGRRGKDSRIVWAKPGAIAFAKAFLDETVSAPPAEEEGAAAANAGSPTEVEASFHTHSFLLRPLLKVSISLPLDLTKEEANRLAEFIRAIPF